MSHMCEALELILQEWESKGTGTELCFNLCFLEDRLRHSRHGAGCWLQTLGYLRPKSALERCSSVAESTVEPLNSTLQ